MVAFRGFISLILILAIVAGLVVLGGAGWWATQKLSGPTVGISGTMTATSSTKSFLEFVSPVSDTRVSALGTTKVEWHYTDPEVSRLFLSQYTYVVLSVINSEGKHIGNVGDGYLISKTSALWGIQSNMDQRFYLLADGGKYKLQATLQYSPIEVSCKPDGPGSCIPVYSAGDQALIDEAKEYQSDSEWFTVHLDGYARPTATIDPGTSVSGTATGLSEIKLQIFSEATSTPPAISTTVTVPVVNGKWSYAAQFPTGKYDLNVWDTSGFISLTSGSFVVQALATQEAGPESYTNSQYGFTLQYPVGSIVGKSSQWSWLTSSSAGIPIIEISVPVGGNQYAQGRIDVGISQNTNDVTNCLVVPPTSETTYKNLGNITMGGLTFLHFTAGSVGGGVMSVDSYRTMRSEYCFALDSVLTGVESGHYEASQQSSIQADFTQVQNELKNVVQSFRFTN